MQLYFQKIKLEHLVSGMCNDKFLQWLGSLFQTNHSVLVHVVWLVLDHFFRMLRTCYCQTLHHCQIEALSLYTLLFWLPLRIFQVLQEPQIYH